jgi:hypothetical protein
MTGEAADLFICTISSSLQPPERLSCVLFQDNKKDFQGKHTLKVLLFQVIADLLKICFFRADRVLTLITAAPMRYRQLLPFNS